MNSAGASNYLRKIRLRYTAMRTVEILFIVLATSLIAFSILRLTNSSTSFITGISLGVGLLIGIARGTQLHLFSLNDASISSYLNHRYKELEASVDLLLLPNEDLSTLQQIQKLRAAGKLEELEKHVRLPNQTMPAFAAFVVSLLIFFSTSLLTGQTNSIRGSYNTPGSPVRTPGLKQESIALGKSSASTAPPAYTGLNTTQSHDFNLNVPEGSNVTWTLNFSGGVRETYFVLSGKDTVRLAPTSILQYSTSLVLNESGFYQVQWIDSSGRRRSTDYYKIEVIKDQSPRISIESPPQFTELRYADRLAVDLKATLSDDYGLQDAYVIATVSKGSGESVKFREEKIRFMRPQPISGKSTTAEHLIDLHQLGMNPGDELYFYVEAVDNKTPIPNHTRTETFFVAVRDTSSQQMSDDTGMGVDIMPEYFRSQRQIIIDSEKLLDEQKRKKITKETFNGRSNGLAFDQKVLRLRYGQYMGEENESGSLHDESEEGHNDEDVMKKFGHNHDSQNDQNTVEEKSSGAEKGLKENSGKKDDGNKAQITLLGQSVTAKLKAALNLMWDAELHLRLNDPARSLPFQHRILKLLKEISNDSRVYVRRSGFEPPPVKEDRRLNGDLTEIGNSTVTNQTKSGLDYPNIRQALSLLERLLDQVSPQISRRQKELLLRAGNELAGVAMEYPSQFLHSLSLIKTLINDEPVHPSKLKPGLSEIRAAFYKILPKQVASPMQQSLTPHKLDAAFVKQLEQLKHE
jgi:hypothetical protein